MTIKFTFARTVAAAAAFIGAVAFYTLPAHALTVGDAAPPLKVGKWLKGEPITEFKPGTTYVVEFWATWCEPCRLTIPRMTELAHKNKDVVFIGQDVWERDDAAPEPFVQEMGAQMDYHVATDDKSAQPEGAMANTWMKAANRDYIPSAFIVNKEGKIAWIGDAPDVEQPLSEIQAGTYDMEKAKQAYAVVQAKAIAMEGIQLELQAKVAPHAEAQDFDGAVKALDGIIAAHPDPDVRAQLLTIKFSLLVRGGQLDAAYGVCDELAATNKDDPQLLNTLAWVITTSPQIQTRDLDRAQKYAEASVAASKQQAADPMDTLARVFATKNDFDKAVEWQTKAVAIAGDAEKSALQASLDAYKAKHLPTTQPGT